ncbi:MAG TPA: phosphoribosyl-AMP cyclohydrolase [Smithellaceae bacterium]|jgi:phosphoribosyl-AMP cyclohydrolase|nr:MAG: phosphoribosyl-AMP cyclohydrolase [Deltaproteobacteria bacterium ADurb.BinA014]HNQ18336.1 phosphoribosyl-AMP cyclohydrolase [Smithellaceae bacterium]HNT91617.1 phosphoribosyl-AMP cyclohydrolase [Smithellaceae bacterium]HNV64482.1 phosphoribosyl-AMP cyclohydrolase [Smithellaceae bacterium]HNZ32387.1 phosphoribosyl-AMP cyclohydrolase [Smithellaceae bacterium]
MDKIIEPNFSKGDGLIPAIVQDLESRDILMLAYMNRQAWEATLQTGRATYWSRSRQALWVKGETSGNFQMVKNVFIDCDNDTLLLQVEQIGKAACHTGYKSCFYRKLEGKNFVVVGEKIFDPEEVYK